MPPKRGKKAAAVMTTAIAEPVADSADSGPNDTAQLNNKPVKAETKKTKPTKAVKNAKQVQQNENGANEEAVASPKVSGKSKKNVAPGKKNPEQIEPIEQNGGSVDEEVAVPVKAEAKSKRAAVKKNAKQIEQAANTVENEENGEAVIASPQKGKKRAARGKPKKDESPKVQVTKAPTGRSKRAERPESEHNIGFIVTASSKTDKKSAKTKPAKNDEVMEKVTEPKSKRGVKKEKSPVKQKPDDNKKSAKGKAKKADAAKSKALKQEEDEEEEVPPTDQIENAQENNEADSAKGRKRKPVKTYAKSKALKQEEDEEEEVPPTDQIENAQENNEADSAKGRKRKPVKTDASSPAKKSKNETVGATVKSPESNANGESRKRKAVADSTTIDAADDKLVTKRKKAPKDEAKKEPKAKMNQTATDYSAINFDSTKEFGMKIVSWNVAGLRALVGKDGFDYFEYEKPDIICLQDIKCLEDEVPEKAKLKGYHPYWCSTEGGRGGVAILSKQMPYNVEKNIGDEEMDEEGRIITAEYSKFYLVCVYVPNAGRALVNLDRRLRWNKMFEEHVTKLKEKKPVVVCGDMNVAHEEIDLANPKTNKKNAGFSQGEREGMTDLLGLGFIDTFRELYPNQDKAYTFWTYMGGARGKNVGWRLDYSLVSENLKSKIVDSFMRPQILGSDHCPIVLLLNI